MIGRASIFRTAMLLALLTAVMPFSPRPARADPSKYPEFAQQQLTRQYYAGLYPYRGTGHGFKRRRQAADHRRTQRRRVSRSSYFGRGLRAAGRLQRLSQEHSTRPTGRSLLSVPPSPGQFGLWHSLRKRLSQHESARRRHRRLVRKALSYGRHQSSAAVIKHG